MSILKIFVVDDEAIVRVSLADDIREGGYIVTEFEDAVSALEAMSRQPVDVIFTDMLMPKMNGFEFLEQVRHSAPETIVVVMTAYGSISSAVQAMRMGAYDYITKPFQSDEILFMLRRIDELRVLKNSYERLHTEYQHRYDIGAIIGSSAPMQEVRRQILMVAPTLSTVLIQGETGTGKELVVNVIHNNSNRSNNPFIKLSCATLSKEVFESELFGHERGAFTGAHKDKPGRFELADRGTLYLDDVDDIPLDLQVKLLRVIEQQEFERVGGTKSIKVDVRVIASTKVDLKKRAEEGKFREDLFYRLNVFPIYLKPLRERRDDIQQLVDYWMQRYAQGRQLIVHPDVFAILENYNWPGNVRELKNLVERLALLAQDGVINVQTLPLEVCQRAAVESGYNGERSLDDVLAEVEINMIRAVLTKTKGNKTHAAKMLGLPPSTLRTKLEKYNLQ